MIADRPRKHKLIARVGRHHLISLPQKATVLRKPLTMVHILPTAKALPAESLPAPTKRILEEVQLHPITQRLYPAQAPEPAPKASILYPLPFPGTAPKPEPLPAALIQEPLMPDSKYNKAIMFVIAGIVLAGAAYFGLDLAVVFESLGRLLGSY